MEEGGAMEKILSKSVIVMIFLILPVMSCFSGDFQSVPREIRIESGNGEFELIYRNNIKKVFLYKKGNPCILTGNFSVESKGWPVFYVSDDGRFITLLSYRLILPYSIKGISNSASMNTLSECRIMGISGKGTEFKTIAFGNDYPVDLDDYLWYSCGFSKDGKSFVLQSEKKFKISKGRTAPNLVFNLDKKAWSDGDMSVPGYYQYKSVDETLEWPDIAKTLKTSGFKMTDSLAEALKHLKRSDLYEFDGKKWSVRHGRIWVAGGRHFLSHHNEDVLLDGVSAMIMEKGYDFLFSNWWEGRLKVMRNGGIWDTNLDFKKFQRSSGLIIDEIRRVEKEVLATKKLKIDKIIDLDISMDAASLQLYDGDIFPRKYELVDFFIEKGKIIYSKKHSLENVMQKLEASACR
jgi:hypothetical protein